MTYSTSGSVVWGRQIQENTVSMTTLQWRIQIGFRRDTTKPENENTGETCSSLLVCCYLTTMGNGVGCRKRTTHILQVILASFCHLFVKIDHTLNDRYYSFFLLVSVIYRTKETVLKDRLFNKMSVRQVFLFFLHNRYLCSKKESWIWKRKANGNYATQMKRIIFIVYGNKLS